MVKFKFWCHWFKKVIELGVCDKKSHNIIFWYLKKHEKDVLSYLELIFIAEKFENKDFFFMQPGNSK